MFNPHAYRLGGMQMAIIMVRVGMRMVRDNTADNRKVRDVGRIQLNPTNAMKTKDTKAATQRKAEKLAEQTWGVR